MTPEERQKKIDIIVTGYADFSARMDRLDTDSTRHEVSIGGLQRLAGQFLKIIQAERDVRRHDIQAETRVRELEIEAERQAREADERKHRERIDSIEEMTRVLREMVEGRLKPPDNPSQERK
jgi:hypothetical protein